ncbi:MAG: hypothetical protein H5U36_08795 [Candidatus Caldatribacterium sp.]|nr:hypothetical protein [Candidatus Caldatribacterium sp.]
MTRTGFFFREFLGAILRDLLFILSGENECLDLSTFPFPGEIRTIERIAKRYFDCEACRSYLYPVRPCALVFAIRSAERGRKGFEFGVVAAKNTDLATQAEWACATVKKNFERFRESGEEDFIAFLGKRWAPIGAENDPEGLNRFWVDNVKFFYHKYLRR